MKWWKATILGTVSYLILTLVLSLFGVVISALISMVPVVGVVIGFLIGFILTFFEGLFSGFITGILAEKRKRRAAVLGCAIGSIIESLIKLIILINLVSLAGIGTLLLANGSTSPILEAILGGGAIGTIYIAIMGVITLVIATISGYIGAIISIEITKKKPKQIKQLKKQAYSRLPK